MFSKTIVTISSLAILWLMPNLNTVAQCTDDTHSTNPSDMWISCQSSANPNPIRGNNHWVMYDLGYVYTLKTTTFWNYNVATKTGKGFKDVIIDYSIDGNSWIELAQFQLPQATGSSNYTGFDGPDLGSLPGRYILLSAQSTWDDGACAGLSEFKVRVGEPPLPLELLAFIASPINDYISLKWESVDETDFSHFEIQRSSDAYNYKKIAEVVGKKSGITNQYVLKDEEVKSEIFYYYRLKMIDFDNSFEYSFIRTAQIDDDSKITIYPNPAKHILNIELGELEIKEIIIQNGGGHEVIRKPFSNNQERLDISILPAGMYFVKIVGTNNQLFTEKFIKVD